MASATAMYHSGKNPLHRVTRDSENVAVAKGLRQRRLHKAFLRYHDPNNWPVLREALRRMGRANLIGNSPQHLIPSYQPRGTGEAAEGQRAGYKHGTQRTPGGKPAVGKHPFRTQHTGLPHTPRAPGTAGAAGAAKPGAARGPSRGPFKGRGGPKGRPR
jgi:hypothetical protein